MNKLIPIIIILIVVAVAVGYFILKPPPEECESEIPYYFIAIHNEPLHDIPNPRYSIEDRHNLLRQMVEKANQYNIKLTLMFSAQAADYIAGNSERLAELRTWEQQGHEISAHHHSIYHGNWDGYTDYTEVEAIAERINHVATPETYLGTLADFINELEKINPNINSGCMNDEKDKMALPDEISYDACSGYANSGEPGTRLSDPAAEKGKNDFILVATVNGIERKWLTHAKITNEDKLGQAKTMFLSINPSSIYGAVTHNTYREGQDVYFYNYLDFLHEQDPTGEKSLTLTEAIESGILAEVEIELPFCGNNVCDDREDGITCPEDCGEPPAEGEDSPFGGHGNYNLFEEIGIKWKRNTAVPHGLVWNVIEPNYNGVYDWDDFEEGIEVAEQNNLKLVVTITSMNSEDQRTCNECAETAEKCPRLNPCNLEKYETFLRTAIRKYKDKIKYWQVENEPKEGGKFFSDSPENYVELLSRTYAVIKDECPDCKVLMAGMVGHNPTRYYEETLSSLNNIPECQLHGCFDIFDAHIGGGATGGYSELESGYTGLKDWLSSYGYSKPIWSTEFGSLALPDGIEKKDMGNYLIKLFAVGLEAGFEKLFWRTSEPPSTIFQNGQKTPTYYAYKTLISKLEGFSSVEKITDWQYKFIVNGKPVYILWCDSGSCDLPSEISGEVKVTDYLGDETIKNANEITLTESPVFIEEI